MKRVITFLLFLFFPFVCFAYENSDIITITYTYTDTYQNIKFAAEMSGYKETIYDNNLMEIPNPEDPVEYTKRIGEETLKDLSKKPITEYVETLKQLEAQQIKEVYYQEIDSRWETSAVLAGDGE